jgi:hypothetical protein
VTGEGTLEYVYGIVPAAFQLEGAPAGVGGTPLRSVGSGDVRALVSTLDASEYAPRLVEERAGDVQWLAPHAEAHNAVVSWAGQPGPVVPLHMWTMFSDQTAVEEMLRTRTTELRDLLKSLQGADEYGLRVYVDAAELERAVTARDPELIALAQRAAESSPGQRYLLVRGMEKQRREAARAMALSTADRVFETLAAVSRAAARDSIPNAGAAEGSAVLSAAFLVRRDGLDEFRRALTPLVRDLESDGFRFAFTGPWPPYHFAGSSA